MNHLKKLKDPENLRNYSLYQPENLSMDPRHDLDVYSTYLKNNK
jgi:hypothetical protein